MLRYKTKTRLGLVTLYNSWLGNGAGLFLQPWSKHGARQSPGGTGSQRRHLGWTLNTPCGWADQI